MNKNAPIGIFDSGYGGLTVFDEVQKLLPEYDYLYFGDNARAPYGNRSFDVVYEFTLEAVQFLLLATRLPPKHFAPSNSRICQTSIQTSAFWVLFVQAPKKSDS
jgi:hypothetical protein